MGNLTQPLDELQAFPPSPVDEIPLSEIVATVLYHARDDKRLLLRIVRRYASYRDEARFRRQLLTLLDHMEQEIDRRAAL